MEDFTEQLSPNSQLPSNNVHEVILFLSETLKPQNLYYYRCYPIPPQPQKLLSELKALERAQPIRSPVGLTGREVASLCICNRTKRNSSSMLLCFDSKSF